MGGVQSQCVGPLHADPLDEVGEIFHDLLLKCSSWLACSFASTHQGHGGTLAQKRSGGLARSDYVSLPLAWRDAGVESCVASTISAGHSVLDHFAALVHVHLRPAGPPKLLRATRIDGQALQKPENAAATL